MATTKPIYRTLRGLAPGPSEPCQPGLVSISDRDESRRRDETGARSSGESTGAPEGLSLGFPNGCHDGERSEGSGSDSRSTEAGQVGTTDVQHGGGGEAPRHLHAAHASDADGRRDSVCARRSRASRGSDGTDSSSERVSLDCRCGRTGCGLCDCCGRVICVWHSSGIPTGGTKLLVRCFPSCDYSADEMRREWGAR